MARMAAQPSQPVYTRAQVYGLLKRYWGYDTLRPGQEEAVRAVLQRRDSLVVMPTGGGKSLCFQLPAAVAGGLCVVVSPLIALMNDQVDGLRAKGYPAAAMNSSMPFEEIREIEHMAMEGRLALLYVSPKRLTTDRFRQFLVRARLRSIIIDEAHCISQWGHDFVPEYRQLATLRQDFPGVSIHAFTATARPHVQKDICDQLHLRDPVVMVGSFDRPNLRYTVLRREAGERKKFGKFAAKEEAPACVDQIEQILRSQLEGVPGAAIIYCNRRNDTELFAAALSDRGIPSRAYHAGLDAQVRRDVQQAFTREELHVVVATVAFGMGIDRGDVRCIIHANAPKTIEAFQQETGRAGRDGLPASCFLLFDEADDQGLWEFLIDRSVQAVEEKRLREAIKKEQLNLLGEMMRFASDERTCRHKALVTYFGQAWSKAHCGACDVCDRAITRAPHAAIVSYVLTALDAASGDRTLACEVVLGHASPRVVTAGLMACEAFGRLRAFGAPKTIEIIDEVVERFASGETPRERAAVRLRALRPEEPVVRPAPVRHALDPRQQIMHQRLRDVRGRIAKRMGCAPVAVCDNPTLLALIVHMPRKERDLHAVPGLSDEIITRFGDEILAALRPA
jgi:ATP-dependent DNA helicase RecQ